MKVKVIAVTTADQKVIEKENKKNLELMSGYSANICYTQKDWEEIVKEDLEKTENRKKEEKEVIQAFSSYNFCEGG